MTMLSAIGVTGVCSPHWAACAKLAEASMAKPARDFFIIFPLPVLVRSRSLFEVPPELARDPFPLRVG